MTTINTMDVLFRGYHSTGTADVSSCIYKTFVKFPSVGIKNLGLTSTYSFVQTADGQCFLDYFEETRRKKVMVSENIKEVTSSGADLKFLTENGDLFKFNFDNATSTTSTEKLPVRPVSKISCGARISVALSRDGKLLNIPVELNFNLKNIRDISCGREHCIILTTDGNVYTFGNGSRGQLGQGDLESREEPVLLEGLSGMKIVSVAAGGWHSCAVSEEGDLYTWGWNANGQLGIGDEYEVMASPHVVDFVDYDNQIDVRKVSCGTRHTVVLLSDNALFGCGWNKYGQICDDTSEENIRPMIKSFDFEKQEVEKVHCGPWSTVVLCKKSGDEIKE